jgi:hypothetical protein
MSPNAVQIYMARAAKDINKILSAADTLVVETEFGDVISWMCMSIYKYEKLLHFCYTDKAFRKQGHITNLFTTFNVLTTDEIQCTYWTWMVKKYLNKWNLKYNPYNRLKFIYEVI